MTICIAYWKYVVLAIGLTFLACAFISVYALFTKTDFTTMGAGLGLALFFVFIVSILCIFLPRNYAWPIEICLSGITILIMGLFIIYDL